MGTCGLTGRLALQNSRELDSFRKVDLCTRGSLKFGTVFSTTHGRRPIVSRPVTLLHSIWRYGVSGNSLLCGIQPGRGQP